MSGQSTNVIYNNCLSVYTIGVILSFVNDTLCITKMFFIEF